MKGYLVLRSLNEIILKILFLEQSRLASCKIERDSLVVTELTRKARGPGSNPGPG